MGSAEMDINVRKEIAGSACHNLQKIWSFIDRTQVESEIARDKSWVCLLYGAAAWTLT